MRGVWSLVVAVLVFVVVAAPTVALADGRVALVVGNSTYTHIGRLPNPDNDAADMSAALRRLGFEVTTELDANRVELTEALRAFTRRSAAADVSLVFYAGHGIEMDGVNYLVPVDARLERDVDVRFETLTLDDLMVSTAGASLRLVILDACRNNPLARSMQRTAASRTCERRQLRRPERGSAGQRDAGGVCRGGGYDRGGRTGPQQPVYGGVAGASGDAAGDRVVVPPSTGAGAGGDQRRAAPSRVPRAGEGALPDADAGHGRVDHGERGGSSRSGTGRPATTDRRRLTSPDCPSLRYASWLRRETPRRRPSSA